MSNFRLWLPLTIFCSAALLATHVILPLNIDNDTYQVMGWNLARRGLLPYVGSWAHTLPGMAYMHALGIELFGNTALGFRILDILVHIGSAVLLFSIARRYIGGFGAFIAATTLTLYYVSEGFWLAGQPDGFAVFFILLGTLAYFKSTTSPVLLIVSGLALCFAGMIRPTYFLFGASMFAVMLVERQPILRYLIGVLICLVLTLGPYAIVRDGFYQVYQAAVGFNLSVYGGVRSSYDPLNLLSHPIVIMALIGCVLFFFGHSQKRSMASRMLLLLLYSASAFISLYAMGKFLVYHFDPIFAIAAYVCGYAFSATWRLLPVRWVSIGLMIVIGAFGIRRLYPFNLLHILREAQKSESPTLEYCYSHLKTGSDFGYDTETVLVSYVRSRRPQQLEFASITPALLWRSEIPQATRFTMVHALGMHQVGKDYTPFERQCRREYATELIHKLPEMYILSREPHDLQMFAFEDPETIVRSIPAVDSLLRSDYELVNTIGPFDCYALKRPR